MDDSEFDQLLKDVKENPSKLLDTERLSDEDILKLTKRMNPYGAHMQSQEESKKVALISHTNLNEEYMRRFLMTSLVGFVHRMGKEYSPDEDDLVWEKEDEDTEVLHKLSTEPFSYKKLKGIYDVLATILPVLEECETKLEKNSHKKTVCAIDDTPVPKNVLEEEESLNNTISIAQYSSVELLISAGRDAEKRYQETFDKAKHIPEIDERSKTHPIHIKKENERSIPSKVAKNLVNNFVEGLFEYNPDLHVKSAMDADKLRESVNQEAEHNEELGTLLRKGMDAIDIYRPSLSLLKSRVDYETYFADDVEMREIAKTMHRNRETYNAFMYILNHPDLHECAVQVFSKPNDMRYAFLPVQKELGLLEYIPPQDTFHRWAYYTEVNMEEIRNVVACVYHDKPFLDSAMIIYDIVEGTPEEIKEKRDEFVSSHGEEVIEDIKEINVGTWALLADYKENRKNISFLNRHTEVLQRILNRLEEDKKLGKELMKKRVKTAKAKNIKKDGAEAKSMKEYREQVRELATCGADRALTSEELRQLQDARGNLRALEEVKDVPDDAIQINMYEYDTNKNTLSKSAIYTEAEKPDNNNKPVSIRGKAPVNQ